MKVYQNINTGFIWTEKELKDQYDLFYEMRERFPTFEDSLDYLLALGRDRVDGLIEISIGDIISDNCGLYKIKDINEDIISIAQYMIPEDNRDEDDDLDDAWLGNTYDINTEELANLFIICN